MITASIQYHHISAGYMRTRAMREGGWDYLLPYQPPPSSPLMHLIHSIQPPETTQPSCTVISMIFNPLTLTCHIGTAIKYPVPDRVKLSFVIFDIWAL